MLSFQKFKLDLLLALQKSIFLSINLLQNAKNYRKQAALIINNFVSKYHLFNTCQTYRGRREVSATRNDPSWVLIFIKTLGELFLDSIFVLKKTILSNNMNVICKCFISKWYTFHKYKWKQSMFTYMSAIPEIRYWEINFCTKCI